MFSMQKALFRRSSARSVLAACALLALALARTAAADDRDLLRTSSGNPYVFIILDTSGSMNWTPPCTQAQFDADQCTTLCAYRDCFTRLQADDPNSKTYQAKEALYEVLRGVDNVQFGFGTYNQDQLSVRSKHWIYRAATGITLPGGTVSGTVYPALQYPATNAEDVFGFLWSCDTGNNSNNIGCYNTSPADLSDPWSLARMQRLPKGGTLFNQDVTYYVLWAGVTYKVKYHPTGVFVPVLNPLTTTAIPSKVQIDLRIDKCTNGTCSSTTNTGDILVNFNLSYNATNGLPEEFLSWENGTSNDAVRTSTAANPTINYFTYPTAYDSTIDFTVNPTSYCSGWDPNTDTTSATSSPYPGDTANGYDLKQPTDSSDSRGAPFTIGDVIPMDWRTDHRQDILKRLAPNLAIDPTQDPDFRVATYLNNIPTGADSFLRLKNSLARPLIVNGGTPLGAAMTSFHNWYQTWKPLAAAQDPSWGCRQKFLLVITDGDESCNGSPCTVATTIKSNDSVLTYVVGLGLDTAVGNQLDCMAANGGTGHPFYPQNKDDLVAALSTIFSQIKESATSFASAAVPTVQTDVADKIYISNFTPLNGASVWDGHVDSYVKPLPLTAAGLPDRSVACPPTTPRSSCHLWDASVQLKLQAPTQANLDTASTIDATALQLGLNGTTQRRVFYGQAAVGNTVPRTLRLFYPPPGPAATDPDWLDLFQGFNVSTVVANRPASATRVTSIMEETLVIKNGSVDNGTATPTAITYVLGDTFHADPTIYDAPSNFTNFTNDLYGNGVACGDNSVTGLPNNPGYFCFLDKHVLRRKMLVIASDDSQLHFFDAGIYQPTPKVFSDGDGWELFSFIPRLSLPIVRDLAENGIHIYGVDATPRLVDVFIDPSHNGTPLATDRQWRTVLVDGFRDGGKPMGGSRIPDFVSGYYALDVTQPDQLDSTHKPINTALVPSCLTTTNTTVSGCGPVAFPSLLWEYTDSLLGSRLDEDGNGFPDLGQTWSVPTLGRIQLKNTLGVVEDHWVAIFGGGMDGDNKTTPKMGNWIYIVDIETGQTLYKRKLPPSPLPGIFSTPADPAVFSFNNNGILDTIYIGTTGGQLFKIDLRTPAQLQNVTITKSHFLPNLATDQVVQRIDPTAWVPLQIFDTGGRPIYYAPTIVFLSKLDRYGLIFGTGDRDDLWNITGIEGRAYVIVDDNFTSATVGLPFTESQYTQVTPAGVSTGVDFVLNPPVGKQRGWFLKLAVDERVITPAFSIAGLLVFSSYVPQLTFATGPNGPVCGKTGESNVYTAYANNGNPVLSTGARFVLVPVFLAPPTVDQGGTKNPASSQRSTSSLSTQQSDIMQNLKSFFPKGTKFGNFWWNVSALGSDTRYVGVAAVPIGIFERNWKETH